MLAHLVQDRLEALLEIAAILGAGQQRAHIKRINGAVLKNVRHFTIDNLLGQAFSDRSFPDTRFTHEQWIILAAATEDLDGALDFMRAANQWINLSLTRALIQIDREYVQRTLFCSGGLVTLFRWR